MAKHVLHVALKVEVEGPSVKSGESSLVLEVEPQQLYGLLLQLRNEALSDLDVLTAEEFSDASEAAGKVNQALAHLEELGVKGDDMESLEDGDD
jgi:hypothetical protein